MVSTLDRYCFGRCAAAALLLLLLMALLVLGLDVLLRLGELLEGHLDPHEHRLLLIGQLLLLRLPLVLSPLLPVAAVAGALVALAPMLRRGELVALAGSGISLRRSCRGAIALALLLGAADLLLSDLVLPRLQGPLAAVESRLTGSRQRGQVWRIEATGSNWFADTVIVEAGGEFRAEGVVVATPQRLVQAARLLRRDGWLLEDCVVSDGEALIAYPSLPCEGPLALPDSPRALAGILANRYAQTGSELWRRGGHLDRSLALQRWLRLLVPLLCLGCALPVFVRFENRERLIVGASRALGAAAIPLLLLAAGGSAADSASWSPLLTLGIALALAATPALWLWRRWRA